jgi:hypothetical protein
MRSSARNDATPAITTAKSSTMASRMGPFTGLPCLAQYPGMSHRAVRQPRV